MVEAQGDFNRPWLVASLGAEYLPSIPDLHARLTAEPQAVEEIITSCARLPLALAIVASIFLQGR